MKKQLLLGVMLFAFIFPPEISQAKDTHLMLGIQRTGIAGFHNEI